MGSPLKATDEQIIEAFKELKNAPAVAKKLGISNQQLWNRRRRIENKHGMSLPVSDNRSKYNTVYSTYNNAVASLRIDSGTVIVGSDAHIWPGPLTTMQRAFLKFAKDLKPVAIIANGDFFDGASISRHATIGWEQKPTVAQELEAVQDFLGEVAKAAPGAKRIWPIGNHDLRFESRIANNLPELARVKGVHLKDHFEQWIPCWRCDINDDVIVRHREMGGEHADFRNVQIAGKTIVTGHDHRTGVVFWRNYTGLRWGVRCGFMCDSPMDPQFVHYLEAREPNWHPAFVVLTFKDGRLLMPELVFKFDDDHVEFRGNVIPV